MIRQDKQCVFRWASSVYEQNNCVHRAVINNNLVTQLPTVESKKPNDFMEAT